MSVKSGFKGMLSLSGASRAARRLFRDESGQSMVEYILILFLAVMIFSKIKGTFLGRIQTMVDKVGTEMDAVTQE